MRKILFGSEFNITTLISLCSVLVVDCLMVFLIIWIIKPKCFLKELASEDTF